MHKVLCYFVSRYGHKCEFSAKYGGQKSYIVNSIAIYEAKLTQKSLSNQEAFCSTNCDQLEPKSLWGNHSALHKIPTWIPIKMNKICLQKFTSNDKCDHTFIACACIQQRLYPNTLKVSFAWGSHNDKAILLFYSHLHAVKAIPQTYMGRFQCRELNWISVQN